MLVHPRTRAIVGNGNSTLINVVEFIGCKKVEDCVEAVNLSSDVFNADSDFILRQFFVCSFFRGGHAKHIQYNDVFQ